MASPNFDSLNVMLSRQADDPVSAATSDGDFLKSAQRSDIINAGIRRFVAKRVKVIDPSSLQCEVLDPLALGGYIAEEAQALTAGIKALSGWTGGVAWILSAKGFTPEASTPTVTTATGNTLTLSGLSSTTTNYYKGWIIRNNTDSGHAIVNVVSSAGGVLTTLESVASGWSGSDSVTAYSPYVIRPLPQHLRSIAGVTAILNGASSFLTPSSSAAFYIIDGSNFRLLGGLPTDYVMLNYIKRHTDLVAGSSAGTVVSDTAWTATGTTITNFTGVLATHVNGTFVGLDSGGNPFARTISTYVSSTSFTIHAALTAAGAGTNGYIIPPTADDILIPSQYWEEVMDEAYKVFVEEYPDTDSNIRLQLKNAGA